MILEIVNNICIPKIELISISSPGIKNYYCIAGYINIDKKLWTQNIMKAEFNFDFENTDEPNRPMYWKGKIYTVVEK